MKRMKMYYVANARMPSGKAHGIQLAQQCEAFLAEGIELELILPKLKNSTQESLESFYALERNISVHRMAVLNLGNTGFAFNLRSLTFGISSFLYLLFRARRKNTIVYTIDLDQFSFFLLPLLFLPVFFEVHGSKKKNPLLSFFLKRVRGVITNSRGVAVKIENNFDVPKEKIITAPNGIDPKLFPSSLSKEDARKKLNLLPDDAIVVHTGQFYDWKGLGIVAEAAAFCCDACFYLVGGTEDVFKKVTGIANIPDNVQFVDHRPMREIPLWAAAADMLLVLGTKANEYSYTETSPMKIFEFLACERPMVVSNTPANREIVSEREVLFYEPDNAFSLANGIIEALYGDTVRKRTVYGKEKAKEYTWAERTKKIMRFIQTHT